jgi:methylenetetrahydrofolate dehydrogenase (NADP+) / methenyltetrahydrofolate cyclohydrolase
MIIDGKKIANDIQEEVRTQIEKLPGRKPCLAVVVVGEHPASAIYVKRKIEACQACAIRSIKIELSQDIGKKQLLDEIEKLNRSKEVDGILLQLPLPPHMNPLAIIEKIDPDKDVDGLHPLNVGKLLMGEKSGFVPCTPLGIQALIERSGFEIAGKHVVILGRSMIVGKPLAALLMQSATGGNATITVLHSRSENIPEICQMADFIIVAIGKPAFLKKEMVKPDAVVIDVGINRIPSSKKIVGDADFDPLAPYCKAITPVPGGVGPMTIAMLLANTLKSYLRTHPLT